MNELGDYAEKNDEQQRQALSDYTKVNLDTVQEIRDKIQDLSSRFYELIPLKGYVNEIAPPISTTQMVKEKYNTLTSLIDIEKASKILLGALYRQDEMHPSDYLFKALNVDLQYLDSNSPEHGAIFNYIQAGNQGNVNFKTHKVNIFKIQRKGEVENFSDFESLPN